MEIDTEEIPDNHERSELEGEVDIEAELISSLDELEKERKKNKLLKKELSKIKESTQDSIDPDETKKVFMDLQVKLEKSKMIEETLTKKLEEKERIQVELENEIVSLRGKLQRKDIKQNFDKSIEILNQIISSQRSVYDKSRLGYNQKDTEMESSSKITKNDKRSYVEIVRESVRKEDCEPLKENMQKSEMKKHEEDERAWK